MQLMSGLSDCMCGKWIIKQMLWPHIEQHIPVYKNLKCLESNIEQAAGAISASYQVATKFWLCGNGDSATDSLHIVEGVFPQKISPSFDGVFTFTDTSVITCAGNGDGFSEISL